MPLSLEVISVEEKISLITRDEKGYVSGVAETKFWALASLQRLTTLVPPRNFN
jgi:hypothetical protein